MSLRGVARESRLNLHYTACMVDRQPREYARILLIKPSSPGDIIHALPVLRGLRRRFPRAHIAWLVATPFANLLEADPDISEIIAFDRRHFGRLGRSMGATRDFFRFMRELRGRRFDLVIDLQGLFRSGFLAWASGAGERIGFRDARELAWVFYNRRIPRQPRDMHAADKSLAVMELLGLDGAVPWSTAKSSLSDVEVPEPAAASFSRRACSASTPEAPEASHADQSSRPHPAERVGNPTARTATANEPVVHANAMPDFRIALKDDDRERAGALLAEAGINPSRGYAVLVPVTRWETKCWPADRYGQLARLLKDRYDLPSLLVGGAGDVALGEQAAAASQTEPASSRPGSRDSRAAVNLCGRTTLRELAAIVERARVVVTADSTPMHMAAAFGRPLVALFGPTNPARTGPHGREDSVLRLPLECSPCYLRRLSQCPYGHKCMNDLTVERVAAAVAKELGSAHMGTT